VCNSGRKEGEEKVDVRLRFRYLCPPPLLASRSTLRAASALSTPYRPCRSAPGCRAVAGGSHQSGRGGGGSGDGETAVEVSGYRECAPLEYRAVAGLLERCAAFLLPFLPPTTPPANRHLRLQPFAVADTSLPQQSTETFATGRNFSVPSFPSSRQSFSSSHLHFTLFQRRDASPVLPATSTRPGLSLLFQLPRIRTRDVLN
jgi:hypothetical protein